MRFCFAFLLNRTPLKDAPPSSTSFSVSPIHCPFVNPSFPVSNISLDFSHVFLIHTVLTPPFPLSSSYYLQRILPSFSFSLSLHTSFFFQVPLSPLPVSLRHFLHHQLVSFALPAPINPVPFLLHACTVLFHFPACLFTCYSPFLFSCLWSWDVCDWSSWCWAMQT